MNTLRKSPSVWSACRKTVCAAGLAAWASSALADGIAMESFAARAEIPALKSPTITARRAPVPAQSWNQTEAPADNNYIAAMESFNSARLFRTRKELLYRDTLRLLLTKRQLRVWLREDLHLQCELKRFHTPDAGRELGFKLGVYYRFD